MVRKVLFYCDHENDLSSMVVQVILVVLRDSGANCTWRESDGSIVNETQINALCEMTSDQLFARGQPLLKVPNWYTWEALTTEERLLAESSRCRYRASRGLEAYAPDQPLPRNSRKATPEPLWKLGFIPSYRSLSGDSMSLGRLSGDFTNLERDRKCDLIDPRVRITLISSYISLVLKPTVSCPFLS